MTTFATTLEDFWDNSDLNVISEPQSPFEISALESLIDSEDTSEYELEEVSLFATEVQEAQDHIACALKESLESAVHEALAKYSVTHTKESNNNNEPNHVSEISEFWNGWSMDIKIDEEINSLDEIYSIQEEIAKIQAHKNISKSQLLPQLILPSPSSTTTNSAPALSTQVLNTVSTLPSPSLEISFVSSTSRNPNPTALEIISLEKSTKTKKRTNKPTTKQNTKKTKTKTKTKTKKRKIDDIIATTIDIAPTTTIPHEDVSTNYIAPKKVYSKQNLRKKSSLRSSTALKEVFKLEEVLKIKSVDQDCEDEEVDIGDYSTDCINL